MNETRTETAACYGIPIVFGALVYLAGRFLGLSHKEAMLSALLSVWYFSQTAKRLHFVYFRDERLGSKVPRTARFDFLFGLCRLFVTTLLLTAGVFYGGTILGFRVTMRIVVASAVAVSCHLILPWVFVLSADHHRRGRRLLTYDEASEVSAKNLPPHDPGILWGGLYHPTKELTQSHFLATGVTRSGKTLSIRLFMQTVLPLIGTSDDGRPEAQRGTKYRALVYDAKGDVLPILHAIAPCTIIPLNPFDDRGYAWRLRDDVTDSTLALELAAGLIPEKSENNPFFTEGARTLLAGVITSLVRSGGEWSFLDAVIAMRTQEAMRSLLERHDETKHLIGSYFVPEDTFKNIMATISNQMALYEPVAHLWAKAEAEGKSVSIKEWLEGEFILVLANDDSLRVPIDALNRAVFGRIAQLLLRPEKPSGERNLIFLDELREAGELPGLRRLLNKGLSEGTTVIAGFTDIEGLREAYDDDTANEMLAAFSNKTILRLESAATAEWASKTFGEFERFEYPVSDTSEGGSNTREELVKRESILPSQFLSIPPTNQENGLTGYYLSPAIGAYRAALPWSFIAQRLIDPRPDVPKFIKRESIPFVAG